MANFVTLTTHTELKAQTLVLILKANGIDAFTEEVNPFFPSLTTLFKVKVSDADLSKATAIYESMDIEEAKRASKAEANNRKVILLPFDYTETSEKAFSLAFSWAKAINAEIEMLNVYSIGELGNRTILNRVMEFDKDALSERVEKVHSEAKQRAEDFQSTIQQRIDAGELADVKFKCIALEGVPEEQIIRYSDVLRPEMIIMSTRNKNKKEKDMVGSVSAEVAEGAPLPVFVVPEDIDFNSVEMVKDIMFITNFDDRDLVAFSKMMSRLSFKKINIHLVHFQEPGTKDTWDEIKLNGIKSYLAEHYPTANAVTDILDGTNPSKSIYNYMEEKNISVLSMTTHRGKLISRIFNTGETGATRRFVFEAKFPTLIFHA